MATINPIQFHWRVAILPGSEPLINRWLDVTEIAQNVDGELQAHFTLGANGQVLVLFNERVRDQGGPTGESRH